MVCEDPLSMGFSRQDYWSGLPFPSLRDLPDPGIEPRSPALQEDSFFNRLTVMINLIWQTGHANLNEKFPEAL